MLLHIFISYRVLRHAEGHLYICCRKAFGEYCDIQITIDYDMKLNMYYISIL